VLALRRQEERNEGKAIARFARLLPVRNARREQCFSYVQIVSAVTKTCLPNLPRHGYVLSSAPSALPVLIRCLVASAPIAAASLLRALVAQQVSLPSILRLPSVSINQRVAKKQLTLRSKGRQQAGAPELTR